MTMIGVSPAHEVDFPQQLTLSATEIQLIDLIGWLNNYL